MNNEAKPTPGAMRAAEKLERPRYSHLGEESVKFHIECTAHTIDDETGLSDLLATMKNALATIKIMQMPVVGAPENVASNTQLLNIMVSSFDAAIAKAEGESHE